MDIIRVLEDANKSAYLEDFQKRRESYLTTLELVAAEGREATQERGTYVGLTEEDHCEETLSEFQFINWTDYQNDPSLGNKSSKVMQGHVELTWRGKKGLRFSRIHHKDLM